MRKVIPRASTSQQPESGPEGPIPVRGIDGFFLKHELVIVLLLCLFASIRVLIYCMGFPPFGSVDEVPHYALVCDYAEGHIPTGLEPYNTEASRVIGFYSSSEYMVDQLSFERGEMRVPLSSLPPERAQIIGDDRTMAYLSKPNQESMQWPLYYAAAGAWYRLGDLGGLAGVRLAYWIRFMNVIIYGLLVWTAYAFLRRLYPGNHVVRIGVPLLLAFFPQDLFYFVNNDVLTPLLYTLAFYSLLRVYPGGNRSRGVTVVTGLSVAGLLLAKLANVTIFVPLAIVLFSALKRARAHEGIRKRLPQVGLILAIAIVPFALWLTRNYLVVGDMTATWERARFLSWTPKPFSEWFHHPVFTPAGAWIFISELIASFWRGEVLWHLRTLRMPAADAFYTGSTLLFLSGAVVALLWRRERVRADERYAAWLGISVLATSILFMLAGSIAFDFGDCVYPSADYPYLTSGRLMSGAMVPFLVLYVTGLDFLMTRARLRISRAGVLLVIVALVSASEIAISLPVFASPWNWFHL